VFASGTNRPIPQRGPAAVLRFLFYAILSVVIMFLDQRGGWLDRARYVLDAAAYPIQLAVNSPSVALRWVRTTFEERKLLQAENAALKRRQVELELAALRYAALERENARLRGIRQGLPPLATRWLTGEIINSDSSGVRQRLTVNRGATLGVFKGQTVIAGGGVLGQTLRVGPWSSEIIVITDADHALPVQLARNGLRTIAVGTGSANSLNLPFLPIQADVKEGDLLVTSGLGGVFPAGYPVATVTSVRRDSDSVLAQISAVPVAALDRDRDVTFVWLRAGHPASPASDSDAAGAAVIGLGIKPQERAPP
jgi:rod shape-determining protein MreC